MVSKTALVSEAGPETPAAAQWVVFTCAGQRFGLPLAHVSEILTPRPFTRLPGAGPEVCGLVGIRGRVVTVLDLGVVLGLRAAGSLPDHRLLLLELGARRVAAAVDDVAAISAAVPEPAVPGTGGGTTLRPVARAEDGAFTAVDPAAVLGPLLQG